MIQVHVKFFALARDLAGTDATVLTLQEHSTAASVLEVLVDKFPKLSQWKDHLRLAINNTYASNDDILHENDEVAVIPPVSGG